MRLNALVSDDTSSEWLLPRLGGGRARCERIHSSNVVRVDLTDTPSLPPGFGLLSDLINTLAADPEISEERKVMAAEARERGENTLAVLRMEAGLSQADVAARLGTSQAAVSRLESGSQEPRFSTLQKLAAILEVDLNTLGSAIPHAYE